jgi:hypothetical protein
VRFLHIGDIVGKPGRNIVAAATSKLKQELGLDLVVANAENSAGGSGLTRNNYRQLIAAGVDGITLGDHIYRRREIISILESESNIVKPANYPADAPGREWMVLQIPEGAPLVVISLLGRVFMQPVDCPWNAIDRVLAMLPPDTKGIFVDFHAEATSDKQLMGRYLDGRVTAVLGTHTHVTTADEQILPGGTAFQCDVGMTGPHESILGRRIDRVLETTRSFRPTAFDVASEDVRLSGTIVEFDPSTGRASDIRRVKMTQEEVEALVTQSGSELPDPCPSDAKAS